MTDHQPNGSAIPVDDDTLRAWPLPTPGEGDKEDRGRVLLVAGSPEIPSRVGYLVREIPAEVPPIMSSLCEGRVQSSIA
jgi:hypothetical protein